MILAACVWGAKAGNAVDGVKVDKFRAERTGSYLSLDMNIGLSDLDVSTNRCVLLTPVLANGENSVTMPSVAVYGRRRYYYYRRNEGADVMLSGKDETTIRARKMPSAVDYHQMLPYEEWMDGATVTLRRRDYGCCRHVLAQQQNEVGSYHDVFFPELVYVKPAAVHEKRRSLEGSAYIDFPVDQTVIYPEYRRNSVELERIRATIDAVRNDRDATIDTVWLKGYASPESPYSHNSELAQGRTAALKRYIQQLYHFGDVEMITDYEPEDWEGLRKAVESSNLEHRNEILAIIDEDRDPDAKEWKIKSSYQSEYRFMLDNFYPALRHTDYRVSYVIREYSDPAEIMSIMREQPQKLDQNEFYVAAGAYEPGSEEFTEIFETAVRMYPNDEVANLNAANAALRRGDIAGAERYIRKAGTSVEAIYARGAIAIRKNDYATARKYLNEAIASGSEQARATLEELNRRTN